MAKGLVPSEIVTFIDRYFPEAKKYQGTSDHSAFKVHPDQSGVLKTLVELVEHLDEALLPVASEDLADLRLALNHIKFWVVLCEAGGSKTHCRSVIEI